jgi:hypothetical protein
MKKLLISLFAMALATSVFAQDKLAIKQLTSTSTRTHHSLHSSMMPD